jgi:hypothetical protein
MYSNEHNVLQRELPTRMSNEKSGASLPCYTNGLIRLAGSVASQNTPHKCFNNELLEEYLQLLSTISPMGISPPVGKLDHDYKVVVQHFWLR